MTSAERKKLLADVKARSAGAKNKRRKEYAGLSKDLLKRDSDPKPVVKNVPLPINNQKGDLSIKGAVGNISKRKRMLKEAASL